MLSYCQIPSSNTKPVCSIWLKNSATYQKPVKSWAFRVIRFISYRELVAEGGVDAQINRSRRAPNLKNRTDEATEQAVVDYAVAFPTHGQHRASNELRKQGVLSPTVVSVLSGYSITLRISKDDTEQILSGDVP